MGMVYQQDFHGTRAFTDHLLHDFNQSVLPVRYAGC
jgi:hypothetical protein